MADRVVLGSGSPLRVLVESLAEQSGTAEVVTDDEQAAETSRETGVSVRVADPTDADVLRDSGAVNGALVATDDADQALAMCRAVRAAFPDAVLVVYGPEDEHPAENWDDLADVADRVIDPGQATAEFLMERIGDRGMQMRLLRRVLRGIDRLAIVTHDNPDPDAIASAIALERLAETSGCEADVYYYGDITHQENRAFVNLLEFDLQNLDDGELPDVDGFALVDHSRPGVNDGLPQDLSVDVVIDHHPPRAPVEARFVDLRSDVGATSTLLVDYLEHFGIPLESDVATGLLFGIRVDTKEFTREVSPMDFEAAARLVVHADLGTLERIESPSISPKTFETIAAAISNRQQRGDVLLSCVGRLSHRDALAQAADRLVGLEGVTTALVYGIRDDTIYVSARAQGADVDLGETLRDAFGRIGSAGGHADMAGAQIGLGVLKTVEDREESLVEIVESVVSNRFFEALADTRSVTAPTAASAEETYVLPEEEHPPAESGEPPDDE